MFHLAGKAQLVDSSRQIWPLPYPCCRYWCLWAFWIAQCDKPYQTPLDNWWKQERSCWCWMALSLSILKTKIAFLVPLSFVEFWVTLDARWIWARLLDTFIDFWIFPPKNVDVFFVQRFEDFFIDFIMGWLFCLVRVFARPTQPQTWGWWVLTPDLYYYAVDLEFTPLSRLRCLQALGRCGNQRLWCIWLEGDHLPAFSLILLKISLATQPCLSTSSHFFPAISLCFLCISF